MTTALPPAIRQEFDRGQRREAIVRLLLADIFQGRYRAGQKLVTQELAVRCGVSHTPIREALIALAGIGVVDLLPNRGAAVRQVTVRDIREVCQLRRALECQAVRSACGHVDRRELAALAAEFGRLAASSEKPGPKRPGTNRPGTRKPVPNKLGTKQLGPKDVDRARRLDSRLHDLIAASCGNILLGRELNRLKLLFRAFRDVAWEYHGKRHRYHRVVEEAAEHQAIVAALLADDRRAAHLAMSRHVRSGMKYWSRAVAGGIVEQDGTERKNGMKLIGGKRKV